MGANQTWARFRVLTPEGQHISLIFFGDLSSFGAFLREKYGRDAEEMLYRKEASFRVSVVYQLGINVYRGRRELQFIMKHYC